MIYDEHIVDYVIFFLLGMRFVDLVSNRIAAELFFFIVFLIPLGCWTGWWAKRRGRRNYVRWGACATMFGVIVPIILAFKKKRPLP